MDLLSWTHGPPGLDLRLHPPNLLPAGFPPPLKADWVTDLAFRMFLNLNKFLNKMRQDLGSWEQFRPQPRAYAELDASKGSLLLQSTLTFLEKLTPSNERTSVEAAERTVLALCVRLNSLRFCIS